MYYNIYDLNMLRRTRFKILTLIAFEKCNIQYQYTWSLSENASSTASIYNTLAFDNVVLISSLQVEFGKI